MKRPLVFIFGLWIGLPFGAGVSIETSAASDCVGGCCRPAVGPLESAPAAVVRIACRASGSQTVFGSGTLIDSTEDRALILTCAHLFENGSGAITVRFADGKTRSARIRSIDRTWDLAVLQIGPVPIRPVSISALAPVPGEPLTGGGYGPDGRFRSIEGRACGYAQIQGSNAHETLEMTGAARQGDSGGPIFNRQGELVAVLWGSNRTTVTGTYCGRIRRFLSNLLGTPAQTEPVQPPAAQPRPVSVNPPVTTPNQNGLPQKPPESRIDELIGKLDGFRQKLERIALRIGQVERLAGRARELAAGSPGLGLSGILTALGWSSPPSLALLLIARLLLRKKIQRRRKTGDRLWQSTKQRAGESTRQTTVSSPPTGTTKKPLNDNYASQLADVYALSGHSTIGDATLGRAYDEAIRHAEDSSDTKLAAWAGKLRSKVADQFYRIHDDSPTPADPTGA